MCCRRGKGSREGTTVLREDDGDGEDGGCGGLEDPELPGGGPEEEEDDSESDGPAI